MFCISSLSKCHGIRARSSVICDLLLNHLPNIGSQYMIICDHSLQPDHPDHLRSDVAHLWSSPTHQRNPTILVAWSFQDLWRCFFSDLLIIRVIFQDLEALIVCAHPCSSRIWSGPPAIIIATQLDQPILVVWISTSFWRFSHDLWIIRGRPSTIFCRNSVLSISFHLSRPKVWIWIRFAWDHFQ